MFRVFRLLPCLILLAALPGLTMAGNHGRSSPTQAPMPQAPMSQASLPQDESALPDSVRRVERTTGGEVLRAEPMQRDGREVYRMKVLTADGRVRVVQEDPRGRASGLRRDPRQGRDKDASSAAGQDADQPPPQE